MRMRMAERAWHPGQPLAGDQRRQQQLRDVLGQRRDRRQDQRRRPAQHHRGRQRLAGRPRPRRSGIPRPCRSASACRCWPRRRRGAGTWPGCGRVRAAMLGVDQRQGDERPAVLGPAGERRQPIETRLAGDHLGDRPQAAAAQARPSAGCRRRRARPRACRDRAAAASAPAPPAAAPVPAAGRRTPAPHGAWCRTGW